MSKFRIENPHTTRWYRGETMVMSGADLKARRKAMKKTQAQLAAWLGVSQEMVSMMEEGRKAVPAEIATKMEDGAGGLFQ